jgi:pimeloyl-ACP methyl ester carboxylesterase
MHRPFRLVLSLLLAASFVYSQTEAKPGARAAAPVTSKAESAPLAIAKQGYFFVGGRKTPVKDDAVMDGQMFVQFQIPALQKHPYPIVMIHGQGQSGTNFLSTPDGRAGWADFFLHQGYAVYVVDQPLRGRSAYHSDIDGPISAPTINYIEKRFTAPEKFGLWPQAKLHTQWPGAGVSGDAIFDQFYASQMPSSTDYVRMDELNRDAGLALLERIGPAIVLTHSRSGTFGWLLADARPDLVKGIVAVEPNGPPFWDAVPSPAVFVRKWGITYLPLTFVPALKDPSELAPAQEPAADGPDLVRCWEPARKVTLPRLQGHPILIVASEASYHAAYDHCTAKFLAAAGVKNDFVRLADRGIRGNGHMMMLEKNSDQIAQFIAQWLDANVR